MVVGREIMPLPIFGVGNSIDLIAVFKKNKWDILCFWANGNQMPKNKVGKGTLLSV